MTGPTSTPRGEHTPHPGITWQTQLARTETVIADDAPDPAPPNRATRRAMQRAARKNNRASDGHDAGPTVAECAADDARWWGGEKVGD